MLAGIASLLRVGEDQTLNASGSEKTGREPGPTTCTRFFIGRRSNPRVLARAGVSLYAFCDMYTDMSTQLALLDKDPTDLGFPPSLPLELAARTGTIRDLCESYGITRPEWEALRTNELFQMACAEALKIVQAEGGSFKAKARTMAEMFLSRLWTLANGDLKDVPANVQADIMKFVVRVAGLDASVEQKAAAAGKATASNALQININLG